MRATVLFILIAATMERQAAATQIIINAPWSDTWGVIGKDINGSGIWIDWKSRTTGACQTTFVANDFALPNDVQIFLGGGDNWFVTSVDTTGQFAVDLCGFGGLERPGFGSHYVDLNGGSGRNALENQTTVDNSNIYGGTSDSYIRGRYSFGGYYGYSGNDTISVAASGTVLWGNPGNDCLDSNGYTPSTEDCGFGSDSYPYFDTFTRKVSCETKLTTYPHCPWDGGHCPWCTFPPGVYW
jgi:hypothetical protein